LPLVPLPVTSSPATFFDRLAAAASRRGLVLLVLVLATFGVYAPAFSGTLIWDDAYLVGENPFFRSPVFGLEVFRHYLFFDSFSTYYRPVQNWSYILDYWLWRGLPLGYHLTNATLHAGAAGLLYLLLRRLLPTLLGKDARTPLIAALVALVWVVHPIHNAAVAYISGRADSLAAFFALLAWLLVLRAGECAALWKKAGLRGLAAAAMLLALCSKEIALIWLALGVGHLWWKGQAGVRGKLLTTAAVLIVLGLYAVLHSLPAPRTPMENGPPEPFAARTLLMLRALGDYTGLMFFPATLHMERTVTDPIATQSAALWRAHPRGEWLSILGLLTLVAGTILCRSRATGRELRWAGAAWFVLAFLPISNLFPLNAEVAEHWIYLASIGFILFGAGAMLALPARAQRWALAATFLFVAGLGARTTVRSGDWVDAETFYRRTLAAGGISPRVVLTLAGLYGQRGEWVAQENLLRRLLERHPDFAPAKIQLGVCLARQQRAPEAADVLTVPPAEAAETARRFPRTWPAALQLAQLRAAAGDPQTARAIAREASERFPETWNVVRFESELIAKDEGAAAAVSAVEKYALQNWWHLEARLELARLYTRAGAAEQAIAAYRFARRLDLYDSRPDAGIAQVELARNRPDAALAAQAAAIARNPDLPAPYLELGRMLQQLGRPDDSAAAVRKAQQLAAQAM